MLKHLPIACAVTFGLLLSPSLLRAQATPADQGSEPAPIESKADQPATPAPEQATDQPPVIEKVRRYVKNSPIAKRLQESEGFYPKIGGLTPGSGLAGRGGCRRRAKHSRCGPI